MIAHFLDPVVFEPKFKVPTLFAVIIVLNVLSFHFLFTLYLIDPQETIALKAKSIDLVATNFINLVELKLINLVELTPKLIMLVAPKPIVLLALKKPNLAEPL